MSTKHRSIGVENFRFVYALQSTLKSSKVMELDVCGRPLFANPVTNIYYELLITIIPPTTNCDQACNNRACGHIKLDYFFNIYADKLSLCNLLKIGLQVTEYSVLLLKYI